MHEDGGSLKRGCEILEMGDGVPSGTVALLRAQKSSHGHQSPGVRLGSLSTRSSSTLRDPPMHQHGLTPSGQRSLA